MNVLEKILVIGSILLLGANSEAQWSQVDGPTGSILCLTTNGTNLFAGKIGAVYRSIDYGLNWSLPNSVLENTSVNTLEVKNTTLFAGMDGGGIFRSIDSGASWDLVLRNLYVLSFEVKASILFAGTAGVGVFRSTDNGTTWVAVNNGLPDNTIVHTLALLDTVLFAGTDFGAYRSSDNGANWSVVTGLTVMQVNVLIAKDTNLFAGTQLYGVLRSSDRGASWDGFTNSLSNVSVNTIALNGSSIIAGAYGTGVFCSTDGGQTWGARNGGLPNSDVYALVVSGGNLYAGVGGSGLWRLPLSILSIAQGTSESNLSVSVSPNPTNGIGNISYHLDKPAPVKIEIHNVFGQAIETVAEEFETEGDHDQRFDLSRYPTGTYFVSVRTEGSSKVTSICLIR